MYICACSACVLLNLMSHETSDDKNRPLYLNIRVISISCYSDVAKKSPTRSRVDVNKSTSFLKPPKDSTSIRCYPLHFLPGLELHQA